MNNSESIIDIINSSRSFFSDDDCMEISYSDASPRSSPPPNEPLHRFVTDSELHKSKQKLLGELDIGSHKAKKNKKKTHFLDEFPLPEPLSCFSVKSFNPENRMTKEEMAAYVVNALLDEYDFGVKDGTLLLYSKEYGCFQPCNINSSRGNSLQELVINLNNNQVNQFALDDNLMKKVHAILLSKKKVSYKLDKQKDKYVNLRYGVLNLTTGVLEPHQPKLHALYYIDANYNPDLEMNAASHDFFWHLAAESEEGFKILMQILGLAISNVRRYQSAALIVGPPGCGKSVLTEFIKAILSKGSVSAVEIESFNKRTDRIDLENVQVGICSDYERGVIPAKAVAVFKQVVAGETINARHLYQDSKEITPNLFLLFCGNEFPKIEDESGAFERRILSLVTGATIPERHRNPNMLDVLLADRDAIISTALRHLMNVYNGKEQLIRKTLNLTVKHSDPNLALASWFKERLVPCKGKYTKISDLHADFFAYSGISLSLNGFGMRLKSVGVTLNTSKKEGVNCLMNYILVDQSSPSDDSSTDCINQGDVPETN